jgi:primosomal protein N' (replication factor Y)
MTLYAEVVLPLPLDQTFTYSVPQEQEERITVGMRVLVPFGGRMLTGFVVKTQKRKKRGEIKLKTVAEVLDDSPVFSAPLLSFTKTLSRHFLTPWGELLQTALPPSFVLKSRASVSLTPLGREALDKGELTGEGREVALCLRQKPQTQRFLQKNCRAKNFSSLLGRLQKKGFVLIQRQVKRVRRKKKIEPRAKPTQLELDFSLDEHLRRVEATVAESMAGKGFSPFLLFGPPLRREAVYFELIREAVSSGGKTLYLIPEISLTPALRERLEKRLGEKVAVLHSGMTEKNRESEWQKIKEKRAEVVVGPRSALFSPLENVRLIIVDEEQDESYSQQESASYDVRTGAWLRARGEDAVLVYGSAAPTVESFYRAKKGRYLLDLGPPARPARVTLADSRKDRGVLSRSLKLRLKEKLEKKEPVLLFYNRRGYASFLVCRRCGFVPHCRRCDLALSYHKREGRLVCHYCRYSVPLLETCPRCGSRLIEKKGVGVEAVAEELKKSFPQSRIKIFAADEAGRKTEKAELVRRFAQGDIDFLIGTQLLAHQTDFPPVSFIAILYPEMMLNLADFRSGQKTFQAITRALGFLRDDDKAEALIQTEAPSHFSIEAAACGDYRAFYDQEIKFRSWLEYPPFSYLAEVFFLGENLRKMAEKSREFAERARNFGKDVKIFGPSLASVAKVRGLSRVQVSLKARKRETLNRILAAALKGINLKKSIFLFG